MKIPGIHHVTAISGAAQQNVDFYAGTLGLRLAKRTVNFDDPGTYHLYYGDETGRPGTILTFFPWAGAARGRSGSGMTTETAFSIPPAALELWMGRFEARGVAFEGPDTRFDETFITFEDPDGLPLALVADPTVESKAEWSDGTIETAHAIRSFFGVTLGSAAPDETTRLLIDVFGYAEVGSAGDRRRLRASGSTAGRIVDIFPIEERGRQGTGTIHHVAFRARDAEEQRVWQERIADFGLRVTDVRDRKYFQSIYFREPGGILFEIATDVPGFTVDEEVADLGSSLRLPDWLEERRETIEHALPHLNVPYAGRKRDRIVEDASGESFPASDAPGRTGSTIT